MELAALISHCQIFISNDTGVMHVACATPTTVIALFGTNASDPTATGPYPSTPNHLTIARPNIATIGVTSVLHAIENHVRISPL